MRGKTVVITGASSGIGAAAAGQLAELGATVAVVGRSPEKTRAVAQRIGGQPHPVDYGRLDDVHRLAGDLLAAYERIDILANNAGAIFTARTISADGHEMTFQVNHLAPFLLTNLLTDLLVASAPARVVTVASDAHAGARLDLDDPQFTRRRYGAMAVYGQSKLANILFTVELARRLRGRGVTANCLHPGVVATEFGSKSGGLFAFGWWFVRPFARSPERGARTSVYLATSPEVADVTGRYFVDSRPATPRPPAMDADLARRLWDVSERMTGLVAAGRNGPEAGRPDL